MRLMTVVIACGFNTAFAQSTTTLFAPGTDGAKLESKFKDLAAGCLGKYAEYGPEFIPQEAKRQFGPNLARPLEPSRLIEGIRFDRLTRTIVSRTTPLLDQIGSPNIAINAVDIRLPDAAPAADLNSLVFSINCGTQLRAALKQGFDFGWSLPGTVAAALTQTFDFQANSEERNTLVIMYGTFVSPLHFALTSQNSELSARGHSAVFEYYLRSDSKDLSNQEVGYLRGIRGWLATATASREAANIVGASLSGNAGLFGLTADISASAKVNFNSQFSATAFTIILDKPIDPKTDIVKLPPLAQISNSLQNSAKFFPETELTYVRDGKFALQVSIAGLPIWLCTNQWEASSKDVEDVGKMQANFNQGSGACELSTLVSTTKDLSSVRLDFENKGRPLSLPSQSIGYLRLSNTYRTKLLADPRVGRAGEAAVVFNRNSALPSYTIEIPFTIYPTGQSQDVLVSDSLDLKCDGASPKYSAYPSQIPAQGPSGQYRLAVGITFDPGAVPTGPCVLTAGIEFTSSVTSPPTRVKAKKVDAPVVFATPNQQ